MFGRKTQPGYIWSEQEVDKFVANLQPDQLIYLYRRVQPLLEKARADLQQNYWTTAAGLGLEPEQMVPPKKKRAAAIKYRDPAKADNTWSGIGKPKKWLQAYVHQGRTLEEFKI